MMTHGVKPYYQDDHVTIYHGDALDVLRDLAVPVDAVVTDPPYSSGTRKESSKPSRGSMLRGEHVANARLTQAIDMDQMTTTGFVWTLRQVAMAAWDILPDGGSFLSFIDWRQWPTLVGVLESCNYRVQNMVVWDKASFGMGNGFRNQHELVCHAAKGVPTVHDRSVGNVLKSQRVDPDSIGHPSPKPDGLLAALIGVVAPAGGLVLDPFMGSGSTLRGAVAVGRKAIGIERDERYCEIAAKRMAQEVLAL
jgi:site-specific DNA-methyltransferase (adenine-specific)